MSRSDRSTRRKFLASSAAGLAAVPVIPSLASGMQPASKGFSVSPTADDFPVKVIASGNGLEATKKAYKMIMAGQDVLDGVVEGVGIVEADPKDTSVGYGGLPDERGVVRLDSACMHGPSHQGGSSRKYHKH